MHSNKDATENLVLSACALIMEVGIFLKACFPYPRDLTLMCYADMFGSQLYRGNVQKSPSSKAAAILTRGAYS